MASNGDVVGFEFRIDDAVLQALAHSGDVAAQAAHVAAVLVAARLVAINGRIGLARLPAAWMAYAVVAKNESGTVIGLELDPDAPLEPSVQQKAVAVAAQFRAVGAQLAWDAASPLGPAPDLPDFLLVRPAPRQVASEWVQSISTRPAELQGIPVIATDLSNIEDLELALQGGVRLASGSLTARAAVTPQQKVSVLSPDLVRLAQLLGQLASGAETAAITRAIKGDVSVSVRLLQRMNSASFAHLGGVSSIDQAVLMLGRNDLHRWLSLMLTQFADKRKLSSTLQEVALWRARLLELLATERGESEPGRFFTLGLASMLGIILKISPEEVVSTLNLPPEAAQALAHTGPWYVYLRTLQQLENQTASQASAVADGFRSAERLQELSGQAWAWAAEHTDHDKR
jgi:EAL and modified HD-GYP domain-containing signal transduction protein